MVAQLKRRCERLMKIGIFGTGGVGGYFGGLLAHAGHDVTFIARGEHLAAIKSSGLQIKSVNGDFTVHPAQATDNPETVGALDYVIVAVKHYQLAGSLSNLQPLVNTQTTLVPLLNGVDAHEQLIDSFGSESVVGGFCSLVSMVESPGIIRQESVLRKVVIGELDSKKTDRVEQLVQAWRESGAEAIHADDIHAAMWTKFLFISAFGGISSLSRSTSGEILGSTETRSLFIQAMEEVAALASAQDIAINADAVETAVSMLENFEPTATSSMQRDVADGNPFELEAFNGTIARLGRKLGIKTPVNDAIYALLRPALVRATRDT
jgi:2-dehydropantoate 2-reductase